MKKTKFLMAFACLGLLITGCDKPAAGSSSNAPASTSGAVSTSASAPASSASTPASSASSQQSSEPVHEHEYQAVGTAVKNADDKDVFMKKCTANDDQYIGIAFDDYSEKSADFGSTSGYNNVPEAIRNESKLIAKNNTVTWKIDIDKPVFGAKLKFGVVYTGSDHGTQGAKDGSTVKYSVKVNSGEFADWEFGESDTYDSVGMSQTARAYVTFATINLFAGENIITLKQNNAGYRLLFGGEVRIHFEDDARPTAPLESYNITFSSTNSEIYVYEFGQDYSKAPYKTNTTISRNEEGIPTKWIEPDGDDVMQPQVSFKVVCGTGYEIDADCLAITGQYNKIKIAEANAEENYWIIRITKIKSDLTIAVTPKVHQDGAVDGHEITFALTNCTVKVYIGSKDETGSNVDTANANGKYYTRAKDAPYDYSKADNCQFNFEIIPDLGYEFDDGITWGDATEVSSSLVTFIAPTANFNKIKKSANGGYTLTKVAGSLTITAAAVSVQ